MIRTALIISWLFLMEYNVYNQKLEVFDIKNFLIDNNIKIDFNYQYSFSIDANGEKLFYLKNDTIFIFNLTMNLLEDKINISKLRTFNEYTRGDHLLTYSDHGLFIVSYILDNDQGNIILSEFDNKIKNTNNSAFRRPNWNYTPIDFIKKVTKDSLIVSDYFNYINYFLGIEHHSCNANVIYDLYSDEKISFTRNLDTIFKNNNPIIFKITQGKVSLRFHKGNLYVFNLLKDSCFIYLDKGDALELLIKVVCPMGGENNVFKQYAQGFFWRTEDKIYILKLAPQYLNNDNKYHPAGARL